VGIYQHSRLGRPANAAGAHANDSVVDAASRRCAHVAAWHVLENLALWRESLTLRQLQWVEHDGEGSHAGIRTIVLRLLPDCYRDAPNRTLHTALFTVAGALRDTHVTLEVRTWECEYNPWPFLESY
jgi:hypothetical protein